MFSITYFSDISDEFKESLRELVPMILSQEHLVTKKIQGHTVKAKELLIYFKSYMNIFNGTELPEPKTILLVINLLLISSFLHLFFFLCSSILHFLYSLLSQYQYGMG